MSSGKIRIRLSYLTTLAAFGALAFLYQNCARAKFDIDPAAKLQALDKENVFGIDPAVGGGFGDGKDPGIGGNDPGKDPTTLRFNFVCSNRKSEELGTNLIKATALKMVIAKRTGEIACEIPGNFKAQILNTKSLSLAPCAGLVAGSYTAYLVDSSVTSNYADKSLTERDISFSVLSDGSYQVRNNRVEIVYDINEGSTKGCDSRQSPLIISMDSSSRGIKLTSPLDGIQFDILGQRSFPVAHAKKQISWLLPGQDYYFITLPNSNGEVSGIDELFGDNTRGPDGKFAANGYLALAKYDDDKDGFISSDDEIHSQLRLWNDANRDGVSQSDELFSLKEMKISVIDLNYNARYKEQDQYGNQTLMKSVVKTEDGKLHLLFDLWFRYLNITN